MKLLVLVACVITIAAAKVLPEGTARFAFPTEGRVVGGQNAAKHSAPWMVSMQWVLLGSRHMCGASLIAPDWVITAGHCLTGVPPIGKMEIVAGRHDFSVAESTEQRRTLNRRYVHDQFGGNVGPYDIGLMHFQIPFAFNSAVRAIALPRPDVIHSGTVRLTGWGSTSTSLIPTSPNILQEVRKPIVPYDTCESVLGYDSPLHPTNVCTGPLSGGVSACSGDSGGPLEQNGELVGIVSWGMIPCGSPGAPSVYTRVSAYIHWINSIRGGVHNDE